MCGALDELKRASFDAQLDADACEWADGFAAEEDDGAALAVEASQVSAHALLPGEVEEFEATIDEDDGGLSDAGACDGEDAALAGVKGAGFEVTQGGELKLLEGLLDGLRRALELIAGDKGEEEILDDGALFEEEGLLLGGADTRAESFELVLGEARDVPSCDEERAMEGSCAQGEELKQGALAAALLTGELDPGAGLDLKGDVVEEVSARQARVSHIEVEAGDHDRILACVVSQTSLSGSLRAGTR